MQIAVVSVGNSKGIRLPKKVLEKYNITDSLEIILEEDRIVLVPQKTPRSGWEKFAKELHESGDDQLLIPDVFEDENFDEWQSNIK